ncbi:uncharacterized protein LOC105773304 [Gossypium raimondii]|uniref:Ubiquinone biosynthesis protein n=1 Tax=Gossypium raimondii TaxID=29730 RepID=A0A0D2V7R8_GOSRA|nr:uncharacterized protein LOC105773304 [Gossypium raimondii]KJB65325.1 hypothetical protein B456_010G090300 [Gossypium raimondii]
MYRTVVNRILLTKNTGGGRRCLLRFPDLRTAVSSSRFSTTTEPQTFPNRPLNPADSSTSSSSTSFQTSSAAGDIPRQERKNPRAEYQGEQARVLQASLRHVLRLGWSEEAMIAGAKEVGISPSIVGSFPRKEAALVEFFMDDCLQRLIDRIDSGEELQDLIPSQCIYKLVRFRLEMQAPYISKWPQALSIQAHPLNVSTSFKQRAMLVDEIWHAAGDEASDLDWYVKRTVLGGIYSTTEIYMLTDSSPEFRDTWLFLDNRVKDAFDLKKTIQEATYLAEAVGAGMGSSLQGFVGKVIQR